MTKAEQIAQMTAPVNARRATLTRAAAHVAQQLTIARGRLVGDEATWPDERILVALADAEAVHREAPAPETLATVRRLARVAGLVREQATLRAAEARLNDDEAQLARTIANLKP